MKLKAMLMGVLLIMTLMVSGCISQDTNTLADEKGVGDVVVGETHLFEQKFTENNQKKLIAATPLPELSSSLERANLAKRYDFLNDQSKIFYVYLIDYGKVMSYYTAQGKISSVNSRLTQEEQVIRDPTCYSSNGATCRFVVGSPQLDGSYGTNGDGIFFFTTEGAYVEWNGKYIISDFPLKISTPVELVRIMK